MSQPVHFHPERRRVELVSVGKSLRGSSGISPHPTILIFPRYGVPQPYLLRIRETAVVPGAACLIKAIFLQLQHCLRISDGFGFIGSKIHPK
jgi:hypothetical protein